MCPSPWLTRRTACRSGRTTSDPRTTASAASFARVCAWKVPCSHSPRRPPRERRRRFARNWTSPGRARSATTPFDPTSRSRVCASRRAPRRRRCCTCCSANRCTARARSSCTPRFRTRRRRWRVIFRREGSTRRRITPDRNPRIARGPRRNSSAGPSASWWPPSRSAWDSISQTFAR